MGASPSSALWSPLLQARSSLLTSSPSASTGCAAPCIADRLYQGFANLSLIALWVSASWRIRRLLELEDKYYEIHPDFDCGGLSARCVGNSTAATLYSHRPGRRS